MRGAGAAVSRWLAGRRECNNPGDMQAEVIRGLLTSTITHGGSPSPTYGVSYLKLQYAEPSYSIWPPSPRFFGSTSNMTRPEAFCPALMV